MHHIPHHCLRARYNITSRLQCCLGFSNIRNIHQIFICGYHTKKKVKKSCIFQLLHKNTGTRVQYSLALIQLLEFAFLTSWFEDVTFEDAQDWIWRPFNIHELVIAKWAWRWQLGQGKGVDESWDTQDQIWRPFHICELVVTKWVWC